MLFFIVWVKFYIFILNTPKRVDMIYKRNCPKCGDAIQYKNPRSFKWADRDAKPCRKCYSNEISNTLKSKFESGEIQINPRKKDCDLIKPFKRNCPECGNEMSYVSEGTLNTSTKKNTVCNSCSTYKYNKTFNHIIKPEHTLQMRATKAGFQNFDEYKLRYPKKQFYKREVWRLTYQHPLDTLEHWELRGRCGVEGAYQLDHIKSINWGWENGIEPEVIAEWDNLRMIPWRTNLLKSSK
jgi:endogenous inhibitor of DNA gyrase (YacG/DUF329 family)